MLQLLKGLVTKSWKEAADTIQKNFNIIEDTLNQRDASRFAGSNTLAPNSGGTGTTYGSLVLRNIVTIPHAQILTLPSINFALVPAPGAGMRLVPMFVDVEGYFGTAYTNVNNGATSGCLLATWDMVGLLVNDNGNAITELTKFYTATTKVRYVAPLFLRADTAAAHGSQVRTIVSAANADDTANQALMLYVNNNGGGNFTGGAAGNNMKVTTYYGVIAT